MSIEVSDAGHGNPSAFGYSPQLEQALKVDDGNPTIFKFQKTFPLQPLQVPVGVLPGDAWQRCNSSRATLDGPHGKLIADQHQSTGSSRRRVLERCYGFAK